MANKIFGSEFTDETNPIGTETVTVFNGTTHEDVTLRNLVYKIIANAPEEFTVHDDDNLALLDSQSDPINEANRVEFSTIWTWISGKISTNIGAIITALTGKTTPVDADEIVISDSAAASASKKVSLSDLKAYIGVSGGGGHTVQDEGTPLAARSNLNFVGSGVAATDDSGNDATIVTVSDTNTKVYLSDIKVYTSSTTWSKPAGLHHVVVKVIGGGGAGGHAVATGAGVYSCGSGGGSGGYSEEYIPAASLSSTETVTVGAGGVGTTSSAPAGGTSSFGAHLSASGGTGGTASSASSVAAGVSGGAAGVGSGGDINARGDAGGFAFRNTFPYGGGGGGSHYGGAVPGAVTASQAGGADGYPYGGGGGGSANAASQSAIAGGNGAAGLVVVYEFVEG